MLRNNVWASQVRVKAQGLLHVEGTVTRVPRQKPQPSSQSRKTLEIAG